MKQYTGLLKLSRWSLQRLDKRYASNIEPKEGHLASPLSDFTPNLLTQSIGSCVVIGHAGMKAAVTGLAIANGKSN